MMAFIRYLLIFVEIVTSLMLIGVILLQRTKGQGLGVSFGAGMGESLFGSQMGNVLTRTTVVLAVVFLVNTTLLAILGASREARSTSVADRIPAAAPSAPSAQPGMPGDMPESPGSPLPPAPQASVPEPVEIPAQPAVPVEAAPEPVEIPAVQPEPVPVQ